MSPRNLTEQEFASVIRNRDRDPIDRVGGAHRAEATAGSRSGGQGRGPRPSGADSRFHKLPPSPFYITFALTGQLPSGKNQVQLLWRNGRVRRYPNKTFINWRAKAGLELLEQPRPVTPLSVPISLTCDYWPGNRIVRDLSGQLDAIFSLLVYAHIVKNDGLIYSCLWRRHAVNASFPKVVMELESWHE